MPRRGGEAGKILEVALSCGQASQASRRPELKHRQWKNRNQATADRESLPRSAGQGDTCCTVLDPFSTEPWLEHVPDHHQHDARLSQKSDLEVTGQDLQHQDQAQEKQPHSYSWSWRREK